MANASTCIFLLVSIACATAFQAPAPRTHYGHAHALEKARAPHAPRHSTGLPLRRSPASSHGPAAPVMSAAVLEFAVPIAVTVPRLPSLASSMSRSTLLGGAVFLALMKMYQLGAGAAPTSWTLFAHAAAGALGGLAALAGDSALFGESRRAVHALWESMKFTAVTKAVNSVTFAYIQQTMVALGVGGIVLAAAGTGVAATIVQQLFAGNSPGFFQDNVWRNVFMFEAFWLTYAGLCALSPAMSISYTGLAISGAISGIASTVVASVNLTGRGRGVVQRARQAFGAVFSAFQSAESSRAAVHGGILFVVYQAVYTTLV